MPQLKPSALIVDDIKVHHGLLIRYLRDDFCLTSTTSIAEGFKFLQDNQPDLLLINVLIPGFIDSQEYNTLKKDMLTYSLPIIFLCELRLEVFERTYGAIVADGYLVKPVRQKELSRSITKIFPEL